MRFAYIDSQGTEVGIPSVEALQLRIELGAITEDTMFYDQIADRWDPAGEHDVFRSLDREVRGRGEEPRPTAPGTWSSAAANGQSAAPADPFAVVSEAGQPESPPDQASVTQPSTTAVPSPSGSAPSSSAELDFDLDDIGDFEVVSDFAESSGSVMGWGQLPSDTVEDVAADLELEQPLSEQDGSAFADAEGLPDLHADAPPSHSMGAAETASDSSPFGYEPTAAPAGAPHPFDEQEGPNPEPDHGDLRPAPALRRDPYERRPRKPGAGAPPPNGRVRKVRTARRGGSGKGVMMAVAVGVVAFGGWWGVSLLDGGEAAAASEFEPVEIPDLPAELEVPMREAAGGALAMTLDSVRGLAAGIGVAAEPHEDWLSGAYLASANAYPDVVDYWRGLQQYVDQVRASEVEIFEASFRQVVDGSRISMEFRDTVIARGQAGFLASRPQRAVVHDQLEELITAATSLHDFLSVNEGNIHYEPASQISAQPVTEAVADPPAVNDEMWDRVLRITNALDALGTLDRVTTEKVLDVYLSRLEPIGIR